MAGLVPEYVEAAHHYYGPAAAELWLARMAETTPRQTKTWDGAYP